ncbi:mechanosensitive ion channel protein MscS [Methylophaga sp. 41_12_T18]|nr:mechanosensitive ion channel protein MscS [Methylophaga sp. 41_12_T18]
MEVGTGGVVGYWLINILLAIAIVIVGRIVVKWIVKLIRKLMVRAELDPILVNFASSIANAVLLLFVFIAALDQLGVNTTSLIALLGAAGLAIGLALQGSLQNFAAGVMMIVFRPFKLGDFIEAGGVTGVVEHIAIFSTILKTGDNREVIIPNGQIYSGAITNYSARDTRRIDMVFGIGYDDDMLVAKQIMEDILQTHDLILADPAPAVAVAELADSSVNFNVRPWVNSADYWGVRSDIIEKIKLAFDEKGISIPYPQMDVHTDK